MSDVAFGLATSAVAALIAALAMLAAHYIAPVLRGRHLHNVESYVWGVLGIVLPYTGWIWLWTADRGATVSAWLTWGALALIVVGAGLGTLIAYAADWWLGYRAQRARSQDASR